MSKFYDFEAEDVMCNMHKMEEYQEQGFEISLAISLEIRHRAPTRRSCHSVMQSLESHSSTMQKLT